MAKPCKDTILELYFISFQNPNDLGAPNIPLAKKHARLFAHCDTSCRDFKASNLDCSTPTRANIDVKLICMEGLPHLCLCGVHGGQSGVIIFCKTPCNTPQTWAHCISHWMNFVSKITKSLTYNC